jgi:acetyl esterase/lipase
LQGAIVPILVCWVRHCLNIFVIQDYYLSGPQETGTDPVFIYIHSGYTLQYAQYVGLIDQLLILFGLC